MKKSNFHKIDLKTLEIRQFEKKKSIKTQFINGF